ncbi:helix-turn-helix transcriptional regulator [Halanaerobium hydrogeniformans]|uniref:Helix-turn-helix type 11 domain protein n=1 Tax=Halanaerobium hydrogeniformans TaxID=656519 RepID=E4RM83_HALHG|nr:YafY family protein [Halanaerobium hydrogeniformans]ADQ14414.1 helix-turn-helix type 11 domain protein [Halanaerobium hydrogeniformans]
MADKNRIFRIIKIMMLLNESYNSWNARKIADYFGISIRTFHRDKSLMEELGIPIYYDHNLKCYRILDNFRLKSPDLDKEETEAVFLAAKEYQNRNFPMKTELESALAKIFNSLPEYLKGSIGSYIKNYEIISAPFVKLEKHQQKFNKIKEAMSSNLQIMVKYYSMSSDEIRERKLNCYNLFFNNGAPYLSAYCHLREETRFFRIDRIKEIELLAEEYQIPEDYSLDNELAATWGVEQGKEDLALKIKFSGRAARFVPEYHWSDKQNIERINDNEIIFSIKTSSKEEIKSWILSFGSDAEVLQPASLKKEIEAEIKKMLKIYQHN